MFTDTVDEPRALHAHHGSGDASTQTPALVVVNKRGQAEVLTGYNDYQTINQFVSNASRRK